MPFTLLDATGKILRSNAYMLSLKDMAQLSNLEKLALAGATSFKIEGRLKDADYVKNVTAAYSTQLNAICKRHPDIFQRASQGRCSYTFTPDIQKSFNRGFTTYFAEGRQPDMASLQTPKSIGESVGHVKELRGKSFTVSSTKTFSNGDGLCFYDAEGKLIGFRVNRVENNRLFPLTMPNELRPGMPLFRNYDKAFQDLLNKPSSQRKIDISITLIPRKKELILKVIDEHGNEFSHSIPYDYQEAKKPQEENIRQQLSKLGGTIYACKEIRIEHEVNNPFIPSSVLTTLRRETMELFAQQCHTKRAKDCAKVSPYCSSHEDTLHNGGADDTLHNDSTEVPHYRRGYLYNAANEEAREYYKQQGVNDACAFETGCADNIGDRPLLMQCRYCIKNELGFCSKKVMNVPFKEPLSLRLDDGRTFELRFNCKECEMDVLA
jgi:putative protease